MLYVRGDALLSAIEHAKGKLGFAVPLRPRDLPVATLLYDACTGELARNRNRGRYKPARV